jgi:hypothetical protein
LSGVAATGTPFAGALVTVYDKSANVLVTTTVAIDGTYSVTLPLAAAAPLVVEASRDGQTLVSAFAEARTTRLNITTLTNLMAARLSPDGDPLSLRTNTTGVTAANVAARVAEVQALLKPMLTALGDSTDPLTGTFSANGAGHDKLLDSLAIDIRPTGTISNIEVTAKVAFPNPVKSTFTSADSTPAAIPAIIISSDLPPDDIPGLLDDVTNRLTACYALPLQRRVSGATSTSTAVVGTATAVIAPECRTLFLNDEPATYLNNGFLVGRDVNNNGAFTGIFRSGATGLRFDLGRLEYLRDNAAHDLVFSYRTTDTQGNVTSDLLIARNVQGKLKLVGNRYGYSGGVRAYAQEREFVNQPAADYRATGFDISIANRLDSRGLSVFSKVLVTAPNGTTLTFKASAGRASLVIVRADNTLSTTSVLRLAGKFKNAATAGTPSQYDSGLVWASPAYSDAQILAIAEQGVWRMEFFHADATVPNVTQVYRTTSRAATLAEFSLLALAQANDAAKAQLRAQSTTSGRIVMGPVSATAPNVVDLSVVGNTDFWTVPSGALAPSSVTVYGAGPDPDGIGPVGRTSFDDTVNVAPTARKTIVPCTLQSSTDNHCDGRTGVLQYAEGSFIDSIQLFATSRRLEGLSKMLVTYYLLPR